MSDVLSAALRCLTLSDDDDTVAISYLQQLAQSKEFFKVKFGGVAIKNCDSSGKLLTFKSKTEAFKSVLKPWLYLPLKEFKIQVFFHTKYPNNILIDVSYFRNKISLFLFVPNVLL